MAIYVAEQEDTRVLNQQSESRIGVDTAFRLDDLAQCQPTQRDYGHTLRVIQVCTDAIEADPQNGRAFGDRALALAFLGRDEDSRQDLRQATQLGLDRREMKEDVKLVRQIAMVTSLPGANNCPASVLTAKHWSVTFTGRLSGRRAATC